MKTHSEFFNPGIIYKIEHLFEMPIEKFLFGKTRYDSQDPYFRCMGSRLLWLNEIAHYLYFGLQKKCGIWNQKEWDNFARSHNEQLYDIIHCDIYGNMCDLCGDEFKKSEFNVKEYIKYFIPLGIEPTKKDIINRLLH